MAARDSEWHASDAGIVAANLAITTRNGIVTIAGQVTAYSEKQEPERIAEIIPGVRSALVRIEVQPPDKPSAPQFARGAAYVSAWASCLPGNPVFG